MKPWREKFRSKVFAESCHSAAVEDSRREMYEMMSSCWHLAANRWLLVGDHKVEVGDKFVLFDYLNHALQLGRRHTGNNETLVHGVRLCT